MKVVKTSDIEAQESTSKIFRGKVSIQGIIGESEDELQAGERHWHGATKDAAFSHLFMNPPGETSF